MTLKYDKFALTPKICDRCKRRFIWEGYKIYFKQVNPMVDVQCVECRECISKWRVDEKNAKIMYEKALEVMKDEKPIVALYNNADSNIKKVSEWLN